MRRRPMARKYVPRTIILTNEKASKLVRRAKLMNMPSNRRAMWKPRNPTARARRPRSQTPDPLEAVVHPEKTAEQRTLDQWSQEWGKIAKAEAKRVRFVERSKEIKKEALENAIRKKQVRKAWLS